MNTTIVSVAAIIVMLSVYHYMQSEDKADKRFDSDQSQKRKIEEMMEEVERSPLVEVLTMILSSIVGVGVGYFVVRALFMN